jgi:hypothetical protein
MAKRAFAWIGRAFLAVVGGAINENFILMITSYNKLVKTDIFPLLNVDNLLLF